MDIYFAKISWKECFFGQTADGGQPSARPVGEDKGEQARQVDWTNFGTNALSQKDVVSGHPLQRSIVHDISTAG